MADPIHNDKSPGTALAPVVAVANLELLEERAFVEKSREISGQVNIRREVERRTVVLSTFDGSTPASSPLLRRWLGAQQEPFIPNSITANGSDVVFGYTAPAPAGLLPV